MTNSPTPAEARRLFRAVYRLAQRWPLDNLRPDQSFTTMVLARLRSDFRSTASTSANTSERYQFWTSELKALSTLQNNEAGTKYPVSERMMTPHADPEYYHRLLKLIDETIERQKGSSTRHGDGSFLGSFFSRVFGQR